MADLKKDEHIILDTKPHWVGLLVPFLVALATVVVGAYFQGYIFILTLLGVAFLCYRIAEHNSHIWAITNLRVIDESGIFTRQSKECPLDKVTNVSCSQHLLGRILGFGDVEIQTASEGILNYIAIAQPRNTVAEVYKFINGDLDFAETNLPATRTGNLRIVRPVKGAAIALKTRVKLHQGDWQGVVTEGDKIISAAAPFTSPISGFALTASPLGPFQNGFTTEAVFSIENNAQDNAGVNGALAAMMGNPTLGGRGLIVVSPIAYNLPEWRGDDLRRQLMNQNGRSYFSQKYTDYTNRSDNAPIMRYAEVLLNVAEAAARLGTGVDARALALLNAVRNRAVTTAANQYTAASFANKNALIQGILTERRIEFLGEGRRWADIHRLALDATFNTGGIPSKMAYGNAVFTTYNFTTPPTLTRTIQAIPYTDYRFLWPIPADELSRNATLAKQQNPGY